VARADEQPEVHADWSVYLLCCGDGSLYAGVARDVDERLERHRAGLGAKYVRGRGPLSLAFRKRVGTLGRALRVERALKALPRATKLQLVAAPERFDELVGARVPAEGAGERA